MRSKLNLFLLLLLLIAPYPHANAQYPEWSIKGFGSFGYVATDTNNLGFLRDRTQTQPTKKSGSITIDSRLGVQLDVDFNQSIHASVQWVARDHGGDFFEQNLEWAFLRWRPKYDTDIRIGRLGLDTFLLSDYRNVDFAYPWMRPPHEFYANIPLYHFDGIDFSKHFNIGSDYLTLKLFAGYSMSHFPTGFGLYNMDSPVAGITLNYESGNWLFRGSYSYQRLITDVPSESLTRPMSSPAINAVIPGISTLIPRLSLKDTNLHYISIGTRYDDGTWLIHAEASYLRTQRDLMPDTASAYFSFGRRFANVTLYSLYGITQGFHSKVSVPKPIVPVPQLQQLQTNISHTINDNANDQQSLSLGFRWDIHPKIALKAQWSHFWLGHRGAALWTQPASPNQVPDKVNLWSFGVNFIF